MELQLGLALPFPFPFPSNNNNPRKRRSCCCFAFELEEEEHTSAAETPTLSLLPLTPNHRRTPKKHHNVDEEEVEGPVGWPLLNYRRRNKLCSSTARDEVVWQRVYVKVNMEGVGIARKIDLALHHSFHSLNRTLMDMFSKSDQDSNCYQLAYQDTEGDWLLAQDVPWRSFIQSAQRLKLIKTTTP